MLTLSTQLPSATACALQLLNALGVLEASCFATNSTAMSDNETPKSESRCSRRALTSADNLLVSAVVTTLLFVGANTTPHNTAVPANQHDSCNVEDLFHSLAVYYSRILPRMSVAQFPSPAPIAAPCSDPSRSVPLGDSNTPDSFQQSPCPLQPDAILGNSSNGAAVAGSIAPPPVAVLPPDGPLPHSSAPGWSLTSLTILYVL